MKKWIVLFCCTVALSVVTGCANTTYLKIDKIDFERLHFSAPDPGKCGDCEEIARCALSAIREDPLMFHWYHYTLILARFRSNQSWEYFGTSMEEVDAIRTAYSELAYEYEARGEEIPPPPYWCCEHEQMKP